MNGSHNISLDESGINNIVTVMNATDYYLDKAGIGDYVVLIHIFL